MENNEVVARGCAYGSPRGDTRLCGDAHEQSFRSLERGAVKFLNTTTLSDYRIDGHPTIYGRRKGSPLKGEDCSHWCLPGVPDVWNQIFSSKEEKKCFFFLLHSIGGRGYGGGSGGPANGDRGNGDRGNGGRDDRDQ
ncbi:hypothetical protein CTI12_AA165540 [Artemisia annua]|uniref:Trichome birefringence-like C-terminal domain-containing protein n=1 Tax=Artemisia annua TaxID=35608 RepID=A0A2U1PD42_ARTAN|nr:hypothetical protein CTI12_AA165540 [Artemisia annua]